MEKITCISLPRLEQRSGKNYNVHEIDLSIKRNKNRMPSVHIRFYEELNFFLPDEQRKKTINMAYSKGTTVKAIIELCGVPHTEVDLVLVNSESVGFEYRLNDNDMISVYPVFESFDISGISKVRPIPLRVIRFVLDVHLGKLAQYLRLIGFDTIYSNSFTDDVISAWSVKENRIILTRDRGLLKRKTVTHGFYIKPRKPDEQLREVVRRFDLMSTVKPFTRCTFCNRLLEPVGKEKIIDMLPDAVKEKYDDFMFCISCRKVYWKGTHWDNMEKLISDIRE